MAKKFGVEWKSFYMTMGAYDFVMTIEAPDDAAVAKFVLSLRTRQCSDDDAQGVHGDRVPGDHRGRGLRQPEDRFSHRSAAAAS